MLINIFYDSSDDCDLIDLSLQSFESVKKIQNSFLKWLYDKNNDHEYWVYRKGQKIGCAYDTNAFINWINQFHSDYTARIIKQHVSISNDYPTIYF